MKHKYTTRIIYIFFLVIVIAGCSGMHKNEEANKSNVTDVSFKNSHDQSVTEKMKQLLENEEEVKNIRAVNSDKELLIAAEINHMDRFRLKEIQQKLEKKVKKQYEDYKVTISTDKKIFLELEQLENKMRTENLSKKKFEKEMNRIKNLSKETT
ncbi:YhcN/YlaJ family sporulation lipoprotein [Metabacillus fastidiosus]|uniref:YhcN/YlaJ family sporulation lipoprotein n=1 Tax=Metabacillus fastidiosus TaxID=1458 RepID=UPI002E1C8320|nr:YhcN/YlaJ family sporulation lipoprotein [Metabacillus fastidiosus]